MFLSVWHVPQSAAWPIRITLQNREYASLARRDSDASGQVRHDGKESRLIEDIYNILYAPVQLSTSGSDTQLIQSYTRTLHISYFENKLKLPEN